MKQRRHYNAGRQYRKPRSGNDYSPHKSVSNPDNNGQINLKTFDLEAFPPATLLQEYEYATDGAANRLIDMAIEEQQRRFAREEAEDRFNKKTIRISQFFGFVAFLVILIETLVLFKSGKEQLGLVIFFGALGVGFLSSLSIALCNKGNILKNTENKAKSKPVTPVQAPAITAPSNHSSHPQERRHNNNSNGATNYRGHGAGDNRRRNDRSRRRRNSSAPRP